MANGAAGWYASPRREIASASRRYRPIMCGKFTALASWREVVAFSEPLTKNDGGDAPEGDGSNDEIVTYRVGGLLPVIVWDAETRTRRVVEMRWGFPDPRDWRRPRPIHARSETIEAKEPFRTPFHAGQRGIGGGDGGCRHAGVSSLSFTMAAPRSASSARRMERWQCASVSQ